MKLVFQGHSPSEVRRYRLIKAVLGVAMIPLAWTYMQKPARTVRHLVISRSPVVTTDEAMRGDFPLEWAVKSTGPLRKMGKHEVSGQGPRSVGVMLYQGDQLVGRSRTDSGGHWKALVTLDHPGLLSFRAEFRRQGVMAGRSSPLGATVFDPSTKLKSDVSIRNLRARDRIVLGSFTLRGSAPAGDFVQVYIDATLLGRAEVDLAGEWEFKPKISRGGRRTFTIVDEITQRQFGPLPVILIGRGAPAVKPATKKGLAKPKAAPKTAPKAAPKPAAKHPVAKKQIPAKLKPAPKHLVAKKKLPAKLKPGSKPVSKPRVKIGAGPKPLIRVVPSKKAARPKPRAVGRVKPRPARKVGPPAGDRSPQFPAPFRPLHSQRPLN